MRIYQENFSYSNTSCCVNTLSKKRKFEQDIEKKVWSNTNVCTTAWYDMKYKNVDANI